MCIARTINTFSSIGNSKKITTRTTVPFSSLPVSKKVVLKDKLQKLQSVDHHLIGKDVQQLISETVNKLSLTKKDLEYLGLKPYVMKTDSGQWYFV